MPDREKTIKGLTDIGRWIAGHVGFEMARNFLHTIDDAVAMLKEQKEEIENLKQTAQSMMEGICLLKEQEPVKPKYNARTNWYECGNCHYSMTSGMHCRSELIPATKVRYCANCGFPVNWEGR